MVDFDTDVYAASFTRPVLVDVHAGWCGPCRMLGPVLEELARRYAGRVDLVKVDADERPDIVQALGVGGIPDVRLYVGGRQVAAFTGFQPLPAVERWLRSHLTAAA